MNTASKINFRSNEDTPLLAAGFFIIIVAALLVLGASTFAQTQFSLGQENTETENFCYGGNGSQENDWGGCQGGGSRFSQGNNGRGCH
jgi:hypothetical protein